MKKIVFVLVGIAGLLLITGCPSPTSPNISVPTTYTVSYDANDATGGTAPADQSKTEGTDLTLSTNTGSLVKTDYTFIGWNTAADGSGTNYSAGAAYSDDADILLYAKWTDLPTYTISYDANNATGGTAPLDQIKIDGTDLTLASNTGSLVKTGYTFAGWNTADDGSGTDYSVGAAYSDDADILLYAKWTDLPTYTISYDANNATGGTAPVDQIKIDGTDLTLASNTGSLVKTGYTFAGWNTAADGSGTDYSVGAAYSDDADILLYAEWTINDPLYLSSFQSDYAGYETEGGQSWWEFTIEDAAILNSEDWKIYTANGIYTPTLMMASSDLPSGWFLTEGDIIRIHSDKYDYSGPNDMLSSNDGGDGKYDFVYTDYTPNNRSGIIWIENSNSDVLDFVFYNRTGDIAQWATHSDSIAAISSSVALGEWPSTDISTSFQYDSSINIAELIDVSEEGNAAADWHGATVRTVDSVIDIAAIPGVTAPTVGETPVMTITETAQYTGTVSWSPADNPFDYSTVYTATITLTAKSGYTLTGVTADFFTVAGASSVTNDADSGVITAVFPETDAQVFAIGDTGPAGGLIFYIDTADAHSWTYLEVAPASTEWTSKEWGDSGTGIGGDAALTGIGEGQAATGAIVAHMEGQSITGTAAQLCDGLSEGGYSDWFLPSKDELNAIWDNIVDDGTGANSFVGGFASGSYWSSSELDSGSAWAQLFSGGFQGGLNKNDNVTRVRAVRAF